jgi:hypothetical protein
MSEPDHARRAPKSYFALVRTHAVDLAATAFLFVCVSIAAGRIWRYPFDDEIFTLVRIEPAAVRAQIVAFPATDLGITQAWIVVPAIVIFILASISEIDRRDPAKPAHLLLLMLVPPVIIGLAGFARPYSFLYLAPVVAALLTLYFDRQLWQGRVGSALAGVALVLATSVSAIGNVNFGTHPFKRNSVVPYQTVLNFIDRNAKGTVLVISTEPVVPWVLHKFGENRCAGFFLLATRCLDSGRHYDSIFVISGHNGNSADKELTGRFDELIAAATAGRTKLASAPMGYDADAALKSRLTGVPLDANILTVDYYR